eukprot:Skav229273  [mRNA]  locus=scaffold952:252309:252946:+ [translate_table: standard]
MQCEGSLGAKKWSNQTNRMESQKPSSRVRFKPPRPPRTNWKRRFATEVQVVPTRWASQAVLPTLSRDRPVSDAGALGDI